MSSAAAMGASQSSDSAATPNGELSDDAKATSILNSLLRTHPRGLSSVSGFATHATAAATAR